MINIIGTILGSSGYDSHTRQLANALSKTTDVKLTTQLQPGQEKLLTDKELELIKKPGEPDINLIITAPLHWKQHCLAKRNWVYLIWEGDKIPQCYIDECLNPDIEYVFVASEHTKKAVLKSVKDEDTLIEIAKGNEIINKLIVVPHGVDLNLFYPKEKPKEQFTFLANKGWRNLEDRGGIQYLVKAYLEEFSPQDNVKLLVKINPAYGIPNLDSFVGQITDKAKEQLPLLQFAVDNVSYDKMVDFYSQGDVFVMPSRAEAFGIPAIEAMACGLPVITTNFGGQTDFCNNDNGWIVGGELEEIQHELQYEGIKWLTPSVDELKKAMRTAYQSGDELCQNYKSGKGLKVLETAKEFTWDNSAQKIKELI